MNKILKENMEELMKNLNSKKYQKAIRDFYKNRVAKLDETQIDEESFVSYAKAFTIQKYLNPKTEDCIRRDIMFDTYTGKIDINDIADLLITIKESANPTVNMLVQKHIDYMKELQEYEDTLAFKELSKREDEIEKTIKEINGFTTIEEIKSGVYKAPRNYKISAEELEVIEKARKVPEKIQLIHTLYDEEAQFRIVCNYDAIDDEELKQYAYHTDKANPEFEIIYEDGTIVNYYRGDIRIKPFKFADVMYYTKLEFAKEYYADEDDERTPIAKILSGKMDSELDIFSMTEDDLEENLYPAFTTIYAKMYVLDQEQPKAKMIKAEKELDKIKKLVKAYNL
jgi:hypothetical protein